MENCVITVLLFYKEGNDEFEFFSVAADYCDFLRQVDNRVPYTRHDKSHRPFIGVLIHIHDKEYYAPLTSPKPKHLKMRNQIDFIKIDDGRLGAVNFNNMIPVRPDFLKKIDLKIYDTDTEEEVAYKNLLADQRSWCTANEKMLLSYAERLYMLITEDKAWKNLKERCCDFTKVEIQADAFEIQLRKLITA